VDYKSCANNVVVDMLSWRKSE
jgi:hypothetical protein